MKKRARLLIALAVIAAGAVAGCARDDAAGNLKTASTDAWSRQTRVPGEYLVTVTAGADAKAIADLYGRFGIKRMQDLGNNVHLLSLSKDPGPETMDKLRSGNAQIKAVQPNVTYRTQ